MIARGITLALLVLAMPAQGFAGASLREKADAALNQAQAELAKDRTERFEARRDISKKIRAAQSALDEARRLDAKLRADLAELKQSEGDAQRESARRERRAELLARSLRSIARVSVKTPAEIAEQSGTIEQGVGARLDALAAAMRPRLSERAIVDRSGRKRTVDVVQLGDARAFALGETDEDTGLLIRAGEELQISGVALPTPAGLALRDFVEDKGVGYLPLDLDGTLIRQSPSTHNPGWLEAGGAFIWPILIVGLLGFVLLLERAVTLRRDKPDSNLLARASDALEQGQVDRAWGMVSARETGLERVLAEGLRYAPDTRERLEAALESALLAEEPRLERSLGLIAAAAGVAPLLGLLGTVTGMIGTFDVIAVHGTQNPSLLSSGISMALVTTQVGLVVAVPLLLGHAWVSRAVERRQVQLEEARTALLGLIEGLDPKSLETHLVNPTEARAAEAGQ